MPDRDPEVRKYFPEGTLTYEETKEELEWIINVYYGQYGFGLWATIHKETGEFIGRCGLIPWTIERRPGLISLWSVDGLKMSFRRVRPGFFKYISYKKHMNSILFSVIMSPRLGEIYATY